MAVADHLHIRPQILVVVVVEEAHKALPRLPGLPDKETTAEQDQELTPAAAAVVLALSEAVRLLALLAVLVVLDQHGLKTVWTMQAAAAVVVNKPWEERLAVLVVAATAQTTRELQRFLLPEL